MRKTRRGVREPECLHTKFHLNAFIVSAAGSQKPQFWANFDTFGGCCTNPLLPMTAKFGVLQQIQGLHLQAKFHLSVFIVSASDGKKTQFSANFDILGVPVPTPFHHEGQIWCPIVDPRCTFTCEISSRSVYSVVLWRRKIPIFAIFWTSAFSDVADWHQSQKVEHGCSTTNLPLSNGIKIVSVLQRLHGEIGRTNSDVQKRDGQTNRQTRNCKHRRAAAKPAACAKLLMLSTLGSKGKWGRRVR